MAIVGIHLHEYECGMRCAPNKFIDDDVDDDKDEIYKLQH